MSAKTNAFGVRLDDESVAKLQQLAEETDRTMGSVIRVLIRLAEVGQIPDVRVSPLDTPPKGDQDKEDGDERQSDTR